MPSPEPRGGHEATGISRCSGGAAASWPLAARAQQAERMRRIGVLLPAAADDPAFQARVGGVPSGTGAPGLDHRPQRSDRYPLGRPMPPTFADSRRKWSRSRRMSLAFGASTVGPLLQATRTVPIVFSVVADPVGAGFVDSLARPGGNATGFMSYEFSIGAKWLELLKRDRAERDASGGSSGYHPRRRNQPVCGHPDGGAVAQVGGQSVNMRDAGDIERAVAAFARAPNGGLIVSAGAAAQRHRDLIVTLAARHKLPAVYFERSFIAAGGLISYGADQIDQFRRAAGYVDRILKGEKPADLPVMQATKFEFVINLKTAETLGLTIPSGILAIADEVIE